MPDQIQNVPKTLSKAPDEKQKALRSIKKSWNKDVSSLIDKIINYKKLINGAPNKYFKDKGSIKFPIPADPASILKSIITDFQKISQSGLSIIEQQKNYASTRQKSRKEMQQIASTEFELYTEASNPFSRFYARLTNYSTDREKRHRMSLLNSCILLYRSIIELQGLLLYRSPEKLHQAIVLFYDKIFEDWKTITNTIYSYNLVDKANESDFTNIINDIRSNLKYAIHHTKEFSKISSLFKEYNNAKNILPEVQLEQIQLIEHYYADLLNKLSDELTKLSEEKGNSDKIVVKSLSDYIEKKNSLLKDASKKDAVKTAQLSTAKKYVHKMLGKVFDKFHPSDKTAALRADIYNLTEDINKSIDEIMDSLEKELNMIFLKNKFHDIDNKMLNIKNMMSVLQTINPIDKKVLDQRLDWKRNRELANKLY